MTQCTFEPFDIHLFSQTKNLNVMENTILDRPFDEGSELDLTPASTGKRFANYLIDIVVYYILSAIWGVVLAFTSPETVLEKTGSSTLTLYLTVFLILFAYYTVMEAAFNGKTVGKLITRTRAVREDGSPLGWDKAALRSLCRFIPFEPFSFFSGSIGWHDSIPKTLVVEDPPRI